MQKHCAQCGLPFECAASDECWCKTITPTHLRTGEAAVWGLLRNEGHKWVEKGLTKEEIVDMVQFYEMEMQGKCGGGYRRVRCPPLVRV